MRWNAEAAGKVAWLLEQLAHMIEQDAQQRARLAHQASTDWYGRHRDHFDRYLDHAAWRARTLTDECRTAAARVRMASDQVMDEQFQRERARQRWQAEHDDEQREKPVY
ncbi:MAG TPA: hypothetical protein VK364_00210 [Hymenobacter sp.]|nr:hypothetical protein [Hymenobacter sp.]